MCGGNQPAVEGDGEEVERRRGKVNERMIHFWRGRRYTFGAGGDLDGRETDAGGRLRRAGDRCREIGTEDRN